MFVIEKDGERDHSYDLPSRMLKDRIIFINGEFNEQMAKSVTAQLLYLESVDNEKDIYIYINSGGGCINSMYAIYDTMNYIKPDVCTVGLGQCCSAASFILAAGKKGKRFALPNVSHMIHELSSGMSGKANELETYYEKLRKLRIKMAGHYNEMTGKPIELLLEMMQKDVWMTSEEALEFGLIDEIKYTRD